jgi:hypothetical protein
MFFTYRTCNIDELCSRWLSLHLQTNLLQLQRIAYGWKWLYNSIRYIGLVARLALDPYSFDYLLLCNKICGASHYNMQMNENCRYTRIIRFGWKSKLKLAEQVKAANALQMRMVRQ